MKEQKAKIILGGLLLLLALVLGVFVIGCSSHPTTATMPTPTPTKEPEPDWQLEWRADIVLRQEVWHENALPIPDGTIVTIEDASSVALHSQGGIWYWLLVSTDDYLYLIDGNPYIVWGGGEYWRDVYDYHIERWYGSDADRYLIGQKAKIEYWKHYEDFDKVDLVLNFVEVD